MNRSFTIGLPLALAAITVGAPSWAQMSQKARRETFDAVWTKVRDEHYDPKLGGVNWVAVKQRYLPLALTARSDMAFYGVLSQMLGELKQSHFALLPPDTVTAADHSRHAGGSGETGLTISLIGNEAIVTAVAANSPAEKAGLKTGDKLVSVDGEALAGPIARLKARKLRAGEELVDARVLFRSLLAGGPDQSVRLVWLDTANSEKQANVVRTANPGPFGDFGLLQHIPLQFEAKRLPGGFAYIRFNIFLMQNLDPIKKAVADMSDAPGMILDLRGNPGGVGQMAAGVAGVLTDKVGSLGTMQTRTFPMSFPVFPQAPRYSGPLVVLIDEMSLSTSEILAAGLQESGRATVIGRATGGMVLPSKIETLPGGARLQHAMADFKTPKGVLLEGRGVVPDIPVALTRATLSASPDPILDTAITFLTKKTETK